MRGLLCFVLTQIYEGYLYSGSEDGMSRMWNCRTGLCERVFEGHTMAVTCIVCTRELCECGRYLIILSLVFLVYTAGKDGFIIIWHRGHNDYGYRRRVRAHNYPITQLIVRMEFNLNIFRLFTTGKWPRINVSFL